MGSLDVFGMLDVFDVFCFQLPSPSKFKDSAAFRLQMQDFLGVEKGVRCQGDVFRNLVVLLDLVDRLAFPELFHLVREPLLLSAPAVLVKKLLFALLILNVSLSFFFQLFF